MDAIKSNSFHFQSSVYVKRLALIVGIIVLISCSEQSSKTECPITVDAVTIVDTLKQDQVTYYLVHRIAGWSDKTEILELYDNKPTFDHCSKSNIEPIYGDSLEMDQAIDHVYLNTMARTLEIEYNKDAPPKPGVAHFSLELRQGETSQ